MKKQLNKQSKSPQALLKRQIQALLREIVIKRDLTCVFQNYPESGKCGGYRKDGELILQYDHLHSRIHALSFSDSRLGICVCLRHHFYYKKQYPAEYEKIAIEVIGKDRAELLYKVRADKKPYKINWQLEYAGLPQELNML